MVIFSAELVLQDNIDYNDLVESIESETNTSVINSGVPVGGGNADDEGTQGTIFLFFFSGSSLTMKSPLDILKYLPVFI